MGVTSENYPHDNPIPGPGPITPIDVAGAINDFRSTDLIIKKSTSKYEKQALPIVQDAFK